MNNDVFRNTYFNKKVLITGHTGFKGSWLSLWLLDLGANVYGYALPPPTRPSLFEMLRLDKRIDHRIGDIREYDELCELIARINPDIIFHLAAQSVVTDSYASPLETVQINAMGSAMVMEAVRTTGISAALIMVTSDKCYENKEWIHSYRENDSLGGYDPYSASKGAAEILINSWRNSYFNPEDLANHGVMVASVRAGNVVGGGDWTSNQLVPDCIRDLQDHGIIKVRNPKSTRPWQHVLEPLGGYLTLGAKLLDPSVENKAQFCEPFNFGSNVNANKKVSEVVEKVIDCWGVGTWIQVLPSDKHHESARLSLSSDKAYHKLGWSPAWDFDKTIARTVEWYKIALTDPGRVRNLTLEQIREYENDQQEVSEIQLKANQRL